MKTIIKKGTKQKMKCSDCGCEFSYEQEDIERKEFDTARYKVFVKCPQCESVCIIKQTR